MFQSFTGSSRRPRQVNLSGRNTNPFAASPLVPSGPQQAIASAYQDRQQRHQQRQQLLAAQTLQKTWRSYSSRKKTKESWRAQWDAAENKAAQTAAYATVDESLASLNVLLLFFSTKNPSDVDRLIRFASRHEATLASNNAPANMSDGPWRSAYLRLEKACLASLSTIPASGSGPAQGEALLRILAFIAARIPEESARISAAYYGVLTALPSPLLSTEAFLRAVLAPLDSGLLPAYDGFALAYLTCAHEPEFLHQLTAKLDVALLTKAAYTAANHPSLGSRSRLWLLGQYIYVVHEANPRDHRFDIFPHIPAIAKLLASLADDIAPEAPVLDMANHVYDVTVLSGKKNARAELNTFLHAQLQRLVEQRGIRSLIARPEADPAVASLDGASDSTQLLAGYALTLLRMFPARSDDIRMWLYLGPPGQARASAPAIAYFWRGARETYLFEAVAWDPRSAIDLLSAAKTSTSSWKPPSSLRNPSERRASDWRVVILFLELYTFVLKIMDDEEFLGGDTGRGTRISNNSLPLADIKDLTVFLKNLGFAMYYHAEEISTAFQPAAETLTPGSLARHFGGPSANTESRVSEIETQQPSVAGIMGMSLDYLKNLTTGLLRALYERDSRRNFLSQGHWLMTSMFDMSNFIQAVVAEEERRSQLQSQAEEDEGAEEDRDFDIYSTRDYPRYGARMRLMRSERDQRRASRKNYLQAVAPRLEILHNMPFFIPFETRVACFREFVRLDQAKRRGGYVDSDNWRQSIMFRNPDPHTELNRHHAVVRRKHEFDDAFNSFHQLGVELKEPIQITFKDEFGIVEAGIDGGGVTKEFLTSVTSQAFAPSEKFFRETAQHLLFPNPTSAEELKDDLLYEQGLPETDPDVQASIAQLMRKYEFLGRIVGKCLYEGILIDIRFAAFFLTQWSLFKAGPSGQSAYRPTINDLRDLDEGLYKGLLELKNYPGNVEEDIGLTFIVTDEVTAANGKTRNKETPLGPEGSSQAVTNENRLLYISAMARWRLAGQSHRQTNNFLRGLSSIIEPSWLSMFNQSELQTLVGGAASSIDVADLRRNTQYGGVYVIGDDQQEHHSVKLFWKVMETISDEDRRKVLKFVTSTPRAPLLGFGSLNPKFSIRDSGDDETRYPTTSTCVNLLKLPRYKTAATLKMKLLDAVNSGAGFDLS